jgi:hypothetical protein
LEKMMGQELQRAFAAARATRASAPTDEQIKFLRALAKWTGVATPQELGPQLSQRDNSVRQACKRKGWVTFDRNYWRLTDAGRKVLSSPTP